MGAGQIATPERESLQMKLTITVELLQPLAFGVGKGFAVIAGGVLSMFNVTLVVAVLPALSVVVPEMTWFAPSVVTV